MTDPRWNSGGWEPPLPPQQQAHPAEPASPVRPYAVTGGRTAPRVKLAMEALVSSATAEPREFSHITPEYQAI
ncbi:DUF742 domain-containing protein, partial [Nonomuraea montanisoli]|uniref:DUF742 domain-containing protein n=1 Tax=Nonomuraea montanisoli TaxID=2741721 RepID=UPI001F18FD76